MKPLKELLQVKDYKSALNRMWVAPLGAGLDPRRYDHLIHTETLLEVLMENFDVHYGLWLESEGMSYRESTMTSRYTTNRHKIRTFRGSLIAGADGMFSAGKLQSSYDDVDMRWLCAR